MEAPAGTFDMAVRSCLSCVPTKKWPALSSPASGVELMIKVWQATIDYSLRRNYIAGECSGCMIDTLDHAHSGTVA